MQKKQQVK